LDKTKGKFDNGDAGFGYNPEPWDCRTAQWILRDLPAGNHEVELWARVAYDSGIIGNRSMTLAVIDPSISPPTWFGIVDPDTIDFNNTDFWKIKDVEMSFETDAPVDMQVMFGSTVATTGDCMIEIWPLMDGYFEIAGKTWSFGADVAGFDYRAAQWVLEGLSAGNHSVTIHARVTNNQGKIAFPTLTISLTDHAPPNKPLSSPAMWCSDSVLNQVNIDEYYFKEIQGMVLPFNTSKSASLQVLLSAMILTANETTTEIIPMIDNNVTKFLGPSRVRVDSSTNDSRCIQWILRDIPAGSHNLTVLAKTDHGNGSIAFPSIVVRLVPSSENGVSIPMYLQWWFWAIVVFCFLLMSSPLTIGYYLKRRRSRICWQSTKELEEDFARRGKKVIEWNNKYGAGLHPSNNKEEIMKKMGLQDKD
jgi:hypothetical protein